MKFKKLTAGIVAAVMAFTAVATPLGDNLPAVRESTSLTASAASWPSDYRNWSQAASDNSMMRSYGCWVVAQAKLLQEIGATPSGFNPDSYLNWEKSNGYINSNFNQVNGVNAPCKYAQQQGKSLSYLGTTSSNITSKIWDNINNGYYSIIYVKTSAGSSHYVMIGNALSKSNNAIWVYNSNTAQSSAKPTSLSSKNYTLKELYTYKSGSTPSTDNVKLTGTSYKIANTVSDTNAFVVTDVYKPSNYKLTKAGIRIRRYDGSYDNGWSEFHNTASTWTGYDYMRISYDMNSEVKITLRHGTKYYYKFYAVIEGKEYWSPEQSFTTTGSHSYGSWYTKTSATCTSGGTEERKCSCGATESRSTSALGHNYGSTYYEAVHPHYYGHKCSRCGYSERTGGNLDYYYLCATCTHLTKPEVTKITGDLVDNSEITIEWTASESDKLANYWLDVFDPDGQNVVDVSTGKINSYTFTPVKTGTYTIKTYAAPIGNKDGSGSVGAETTIEIGCNHNYITEIVNPTYDNEGYTLHKCTKCGYSYKDNYTPALKLTELTGVKVKTQGTNSLTLAWDKNASAKGYIIEQYKGGKWTQVAKTSSNTAVTYTVNGLAADTTYTFRIKAYVISGESEIYGGYVKIAGKTRIPNVASFKGRAVSQTAVKLDWSKNDKATGYVIEQYKGGKWTALATTKNNTTLTFTVKGLAEGTTYSFRIKSFRKTGSTTDFSEYTAIKAATLLDGVSDLKVTSVTGSWITLEWAKNDKATGYSIEQYKGGKWTVIATTKNNTTLKFTVKGLKNDTTYSFRIRAYKTAGASNVYSDYVRIAGKTRIPNVAKFTGSAVSASAVKLDWSKNDKATGYVIEQYKGGKWTALATTKNNTTLTFTVKGLAKGTTYSFRIKSFRKTGSTTEFSEYTAIKAGTDR
ncbi:MAG: fibronectin type III domain-containing protein [[Eubacterium] siraeum]